MAELSEQDVRKVARLARLGLDDAQVGRYRRELGAVLGYVERLRELDLAGVEPMHHPGDEVNRLAADEPGATIGHDVLMGMAPLMHGPYIRVPKVIGDGSSS